MPFRVQPDESAAKAVAASRVSNSVRFATGWVRSRKTAAKPFTMRGSASRSSGRC
jgi:hypothetical protein